MAISSRNPNPGTLIHSDQGTQFTAWAFTHRAKASRPVPSTGSIGDCYDNAMIESFWSRMQVELLDRQRSLTRVELDNRFAGHQYMLFPVSGMAVPSEASFIRIS